MRNRKHTLSVGYLLAILTALFLSSCEKSPESNILGTWNADFSEDGVSFYGETTYVRNKTSTTIGHFEIAGEATPVVLSSKWDIDGDLLTEKITSSNIPGLIPVGFEDTSTIISVDSSRMILESGGTTETYYR